MKLHVIAVICAISACPISGQLKQWLDQTASTPEAVSQLESHVTHIARTADDFLNFPDHSQQLQRNFTAAEVSKCMGRNGGCVYIIYDGKVLDLTDFLPHHSGGADVLLQQAGSDATAAMRASGMPPQVFDVFLQKFVIGNLVSSKSQSEESASSVPTTMKLVRIRSPRANRNCGWLINYMGLCDYMIRFNKLYEEYKVLAMNIYAQTSARYNKFVHRNNITVLK